MSGCASPVALSGATWYSAIVKSGPKTTSEHGRAEPGATEKTESRRTLAIIATVLAVAVLISYTPSLESGFLNWDDDVYVTGNVDVRQGLSWETVAWAFRSDEAANWHPLTWLSHALDVSIYGLDRPWGHHLTNLLLHALNAVLLLLALHRLTGRLWASAAVAGLFALHPLHVESVAWVAERKDLLCATFVFLALWAYGAYAARPSARRYLLVVLAFAAALMAKPVAVTVPFVLLLLDYWPLKRLSWRSAAEKLPLVAMTTASCVVTFVAQRAGGAMRQLEALPLAQRVANAAYAYVMYLVNSFWPAPGRLVPLYPLANRGGPQIGLGLALCFIAALAAVTVVVLLLWRRKPYLVVGWLIYLGMLVPVIGLVQVGKQIMADSSTYLPLVGVFVAVVWLVADWVAHKSDLRKFVATVAGVVLVLLAGLTYHQQRIWHNRVGFWQYCAAAYPGNSVALDQLAGVYWDRGMIRQSIATSRQAVNAQPEDYLALSNLAFRVFTVGRVRNIRSGILEAERLYRRALEIEPTHYLAHNGLAAVLILLDKPDQVVTHCERALQLKPDFVQARVNWGLALIALKQYDAAIEQFNAAIEQQGDLVVAHESMGIALFWQKKYDAAIEKFKKAIDLDPQRAKSYAHVGTALLEKGQPEEARKWFEKARQIGQPKPQRR